MPARDETGINISRLENNVEVRFRAVVVNRLDGECIELFTPEEFEKYDGDPKWAASAVLNFKPGLLDPLPTTGNAIVNGRMTFVRRDLNDTSGPCGIVAGQLFQIEGLEYF